MYYSALHVGSLAIDINGNRMDVKMIRQTGAIDDYFLDRQRTYRIHLQRSPLAVRRRVCLHRSGKHHHHR
jgi:hypothetical protein